MQQGRKTNEATRAALLAQVQALIDAGEPLRRACATVGIGHNNYYRWTAEAEGVKNYQPAGKKGRPAKFELTEAETRRLRFWRLVKGSIPLAMESAIAEATTTNESPYLTALAQFNANPTDTGVKLREDLARALFAHWQAATNAQRVVVWPMSVQRACRVTYAEEAHFRGSKKAAEVRGMERRSNLIISEDGTSTAWYAGAIWESDDMSVNEPFRFMDGATGQEMTGRQMLATIDAYSLAFIGHTLIGRDRDSYRSEDIANHFRTVVELHGLPLIWRIEKGRWDNDFIWGCKLGTTPDGQDIRWGGLDAIIHMRDKFTSQGKANIEGSFNQLQRLMAHGFNGQTLSIGRSRGEFEYATRQMLRANRTNADAASLSKFWDISAAADAVGRAMYLFNSRPKKRHNFDNSTVVPNDLWAQLTKRPCPADHLWRFCAIKTTARVKRGIIKVSAPHYKAAFRFRVNGGARSRHLHLEDGHEVLVAFTPSEAWEGCHVFNADKSARNRAGFGYTEKICVAEFMADVPQEDLSSHGHSRGQNAAAAQVRRETRAMFNGTNFAGHRVSHAQDSLGSQLTMASARAEQAEPMPAPVPVIEAPAAKVSAPRQTEPLTLPDRPRFRQLSEPRVFAALQDEDADLDEELEALAL